MSKGASKAMIGGFVIGALALLVVAVLIFGSGKFFSRKFEVVMFFEESISGLNVGAPLVFRGVTIGSVVDIQLWHYPKETKALIPVYAKIDLNYFKTMGAEPSPENLKHLIDKGLRAQLKTQSLVTGQVIVYLDYFPDKPLKLLGQEPHYPEIPTIPSGTEQLKKTLAEIPIEEIIFRANGAIAGIEKLVNSPEIPKVIKNVDRAVGNFEKTTSSLDPVMTEAGATLKEIRKLVQKVDARLDPLSAEIQSALADARQLIKDTDGQIGPLAGELKKTLEETNGVLASAREALKKASDLISDESILSAEVINSLDELNRAMRSIQLLAEFLKQHPEALIKGKSPTGGK